MTELRPVHSRSEDSPGVRLQELHCIQRERARVFGDWMLSLSWFMCYLRSLPVPCVDHRLPCCRALQGSLIWYSGMVVTSSRTATRIQDSHEFAPAIQSWAE